MKYQFGGMCLFHVLFFFFYFSSSSPSSSPATSSELLGGIHIFESVKVLVRLGPIQNNGARMTTFHFWTIGLNLGPSFVLDTYRLNTPPGDAGQ
jgi:hypothetical protein